MAELRTCIGSARFGIQAHEAPLGDFPNQPSQKDSLGRMCKLHWSEYTTALRKAANTGKANAAATTSVVNSTVAATGSIVPEEARAAKPEPIRTKAPRAARKAKEPIAENAEAGIA